MSLVVKVAKLHSSRDPLHTVTSLCCQPQAFLTPPTIYLDKNPKNLLINQKRRDNYRRKIEKMETSLSSQYAKAQGRNRGRVSGGKPRSLNLYFLHLFSFFTINLHKQENQKPKKKKKRTKEEKQKTKNEVLRAWSLKSIHPNSKALICQRTVHWYYLEEEEQWSGDSNNGENSKKVWTKQITW